MLGFGSQLKCLPVYNNCDGRLVYIWAHLYHQQYNTIMTIVVQHGVAKVLYTTPHTVCFEQYCKSILMSKSITDFFKVIDRWICEN